MTPKIRESLKLKSQFLNCKLTSLFEYVGLIQKLFFDILPSNQDLSLSRSLFSSISSNPFSLSSLSLISRNGGVWGWVYNRDLQNPMANMDPTTRHHSSHSFPIFRLRCIQFTPFFYLLHRRAAVRCRRAAPSRQQPHLLQHNNQGYSICSSSSSH